MIPRERLIKPFRNVLVEELRGLTDKEKLKVLLAILLSSKTANSEIYSRQAPWMTVYGLTESFRYYIRGYVDYTLSPKDETE